MQELIASVKSILESGNYGPLTFALSIIIGILSAIASACCTLPVVSAVAGYSLSQRQSRSSALRSALLFLAGATVTIMAIGSTVIFAGQTLRIAAGTNWKIAAGCAAILFGIGALNLLPFKLPQLKKLPVIGGTNGLLSGIIAGIVFGGAVAVSSLPCNPGIFVILGAAVLQQHTTWAFVNLFAYAVGFSVPLALLVFGLSFGTTLPWIKKAEKVIRIIAGIILIAVGLHFFYTL